MPERAYSDEERKEMYQKVKKCNNLSALARDEGVPVWRLQQMIKTNWFIKMKREEEAEEEMRKHREAAVKFVVKEALEEQINESISAQMKDVQQNVLKQVTRILLDQSRSKIVNLPLSYVTRRKANGQYVIYTKKSRGEDRDIVQIGLETLSVLWREDVKFGFYLGDIIFYEQCPKTGQHRAELCTVNVMRRIMEEHIEYRLMRDGSPDDKKQVPTGASMRVIASMSKKLLYGYIDLLKANTAKYDVAYKEKLEQ